MRKLLFAVLAAALASTASAAEGKPFIGVGATLGANFQAAEGYTIVVPINVAPAIRVEPFLAYGQHRETDTSNSAGDVTDWSSGLSIGAGVYLLKDMGSNVELSLGGRLAINREAIGTNNEITDVSTDSSAVGFGLAAVGGLEYYFSPKFALGVEGELFVDTIKNSDTDVRDTSFGTDARVTARIYF